MKRTAILLTVATLLCVLALPAYSISTTVSRCTAVAEVLLDRADPLDRNPPPRVAAAIAKWIGVDRLSSLLAVALLDRFACSGSKIGSTDWMIERSALSWHLEQEFDRRTLISLYAASADMQKGTIGFSSGAKRYLSKSVDELDESGVGCLILRATGKPTDQNLPRVAYPWAVPPPPMDCPSDFPPPMIYD